MSCSELLAFSYSCFRMTSENQRSSQQVTACGIAKGCQCQEKWKNTWLSRKHLGQKKWDTEIAFLISIKPIFDAFMTKFQREEPVIHMLHPNCEKLLKTTMARLMKSKVYTERKEGHLKK